MTAVRPPIFPPSPAAQPPRADAGRLAAQKAFFDLAVGKAGRPDGDRRRGLAEPRASPRQRPADPRSGR